MAIALTRNHTRPPDDDDDDLYPDSDGKPMAESDEHADEMVYLKETLRDFYADQKDVYVSGNNFIYYEQGNPKAVISPDCYVVFGVEKRLRRTYKVWEEGVLPSVVIEVTSKKTRREDVNKKRPLYEIVLQIPEYIQHDPTGDYLKPRLQGFRLVNGVYVPIELVDNRLHSEQLGLDFVMEGKRLRLYDPARGVFLLDYNEQKQRAEDERRRAEEAEAEIARLRAEIEALRNR